MVAGGSEDVRGGLAALERAVGGLLLERTLDRNLALVQQAQARMGEKEKPTRPEDLVRLHDTCMQVGGVGRGGEGLGKGGENDAVPFVQCRTWRT